MSIIFTNGCFDILHRGHVELLRYCSTLGSVVVGLNTDNSVTRLKGSNRPINNQEDREAVLRAIRYVDDVILFDEPTPYELIKSLRPDIIVKGSDYTVDRVVGNDIAEVRLFALVDGKSTTSIIERCSHR